MRCRKNAFVSQGPDSAFILWLLAGSLTCDKSVTKKAGSPTKALLG